MEELLSPTTTTTTDENKVSTDHKTIAIQNQIFPLTPTTPRRISSPATTITTAVISSSTTPIHSASARILEDLSSWQFGTLLHQTEKSISFYIEISPAIAETRPNLLPSRYQENHSRQTLAQRQEEADKRKKRLLLTRLFSLKKYNSNIKYRSTLKKQQDRLSNLQLKVRSDHALRTAYFKRQIILQKLVEKCSAAVERAQCMAILQRLKRCIQLKKSYSASFAELLGDIPDIDPKSLFNHTHFKPYPDDSQSKNTKEPVKPVDIAADTVPLRDSEDDQKKRNRSVTFPVSTEERDENLRELTDLFHVFGDQMPTITKSTLKELNLDSITTNSQVRHDMIFDPNMEFRPNDDGERGLTKKAKADMFWESIENDLNGKNGNGKPIYKRIPVLIHEIKEILLDLVATDEYRNSLETRIDIALIAQQLQHSVINVEGLIKFISDIMKTHCAPIRDALIDHMMNECTSGNFVSSLRLCFEILEKMKLDVANDQLRRLRPFILETAVEYEWELFKESLRNGSIGLHNTLKWLKPCIATAKPDSDANEILIDSFLKLVSSIGTGSNDESSISTSDIPETFRMDGTRLIAYHNEWQDLTILASLLVIFRQAGGPKVNHENVLEVKRALWILLNDTETTISHLMLYISEQAGKVRKVELSTKEKDLLSNLIEKTLIPDSRLYQLMNQRVGEQLRNIILKNEVGPMMDLIKSGLFEITEELRELGQKMKTLAEHNILAHFKVYNQILKKSQFALSKRQKVKKEKNLMKQRAKTNIKMDETRKYGYRKDLDIHNILPTNGSQSTDKLQADTANKSWIEYLTKSRDGIEKHSADNISRSPTSSPNRSRETLESSSVPSSPLIRKKSTLVSNSTPKLPSTGDVSQGKFSSNNDFEGYARSLMEAAVGPKSPLRNTIEPNFVENVAQKFLQIKVFEAPSDSILDSALPEYKTVSVYHDATVLEFLVVILRKWRYLDPRERVEFKVDRPVISEKLKLFVENEGFELLVYRTVDGITNTMVLPLERQIGHLLKIIDPKTCPDIAFRRVAENPVLTNYHRSSLLDGCYVLKLDSDQSQRLEQKKEIDIKNWSKRYILLAKNRYLVFFKSENHSRWVQNVLNEIDFARVSSVEKCDTIVTDSTHLISFKGSDNIIAKYSLKICTRSRVVVLSVSSHKDRDRIIKQLNEAITKLALRKDKLRSNLTMNDRVDSTQSFEPTISPMIRLMTRVELTRRLNDIDLPPFEFDPKTTEWLSWTIATNHSLFLTVKQLAFKQLNTIMLETEIADIQDLLGTGKDQAQDTSGSSRQFLNDKPDGPRMVTSVKRFLRGLGSQPSNAYLAPPDSTSSQPSSLLFGVPLEELAKRYDLSGIGIPVIPPIIRSSIVYLREKGILAGGLFRIAGSVKRMDLLKKAYEKMEGMGTGTAGIDSVHTSATSVDSKTETISVSSANGGEIDFSPFNVHDVAGVLKMFLRDLPEPLLSSKLYRAFLSSERLKNEPDKQLKILQFLVMLLPPINRHVLECLLDFMFEVSQNSEDRKDESGEIIKGNLMNSSNLAVVMGPNILREGKDSKPGYGHSRSSSFNAGDQNPMIMITNSGEDENKAQQELTDSNAIVNVVKLMIERYRELFTIPDEFMEEMKKLSSFTAPQNPHRKSLSRH